MNLLSKTLLVLLLCLTSAVTYAQTNAPGKPKLFTSYPESIPLNDASLKNALSLQTGQSTSIVFGPLIFEGIVLSNELKYQNLQTVVIRSAKFNDAVLAISQVTNEDRSISYTGRILSQRSYDGYEIKRDATGKYLARKFETDRVLQDCSY